MANLPPILDTADFRHLVLENLNSLKGFQIPEYDELALTYYGSTNNIATVIYKKDSSPVATLTLTYSVQPPVSNDANLVNVAIS
jgi:hypothetical protein